MPLDTGSLMLRSAPGLAETCYDRQRVGHEGRPGERFYGLASPSAMQDGDEIEKDNTRCKLLCSLPLVVP